MNKVTIKLNGLVGLLPFIRQNENEGERRPDGFIGILPEVGSGYYLEPATKVKCSIPPHTAALKIKACDYNANSTMRPTLAYETGGKQYMLFLLDKDKVSISNISNDRLQFTPPGIVSNAPPTHPPALGSERGIQWVPCIKTAELTGRNRSLGGFDSDKFLGTNQIPKQSQAKANLAGTLMIESGELYVNSCMENEDCSGVVAAFKVPDSNEIEWTQRMYDELCWDVNTDDDHLEFNFIKAAGSNKSVLVNIDATDPDIELVNLELNAIIKSRNAARSISNQVDFDSGIFYEFVKNVPSPASGMPIPHYRIKGRDPKCKAFRYGSAITI